MKTRTNITTEYTPCGLTAQGKWRPLKAFGSKSLEEAERALEACKEAHAKHPNIYPGCKDFKVMKRTVVTTISELEDV